MTDAQKLKLTRDVLANNAEAALRLITEVDYYRQDWRPVPVQNIDDDVYSVSSAIAVLSRILNEPEGKPPIVPIPRP